MRRDHALVVSLLLFSALVAACSSTAAEQADQVAEDSAQPEPTTSTPETTTTTTTTVTPPTTNEFAGETIVVLVPEDSAPVQDIIALTPEFFTASTGVTVEFAEIEHPIREVFTVGGPSVLIDVLMFDALDIIPLGAFSGSIADLAPLAEADPDYDFEDLVPPIADQIGRDGEIYGAPFFVDSSVLMFNQEILAAAGLSVPDNPTWAEVRDIATQVHSNDVSGICLNGVAGWDELAASLTTVVNTFGGTWWEAVDDALPGEPQINQPDSGFRAATEFYIDLAQNFGVSDPATASFDRCLDEFQNGNVALWYDSTRAAPLLESNNSPIAGNVGYTLAPTNITEASGWLNVSGFTMLPRSVGRDRTGASWEFISWATSPEFARLAAENLPAGWVTAAHPTRLSTYDIPEFVEANEPYADIVLEAITTAPINNPGTTPRPGLPGIQYVGIPEFSDIGTRCTQQLSAAIAGDISVNEALDACQAIAAEISQ